MQAKIQQINIATSSSLHATFKKEKPQDNVKSTAGISHERLLKIDGGANFTYVNFDEFLKVCHLFLTFIEVIKTTD